MGKLLEETIRMQGLTITDVSNKLNISRRTIYNWFKQEIFSDRMLSRLYEADLFRFHPIASKPYINIDNTESNSNNYTEAYWKDKYLILLEEYKQLLTKASKKKSS